jgi:oligoribonuclease NrnB/cAMP/cGMP phosphodiesterase (DHH superfamily)
MDLIITHKSCPDGMCAAFVAKKRYPEAAILTRDHGLEPPYEEVKGKDVLVVDFSWRTREQNIEMAKLAKSFLILDHHKTAQATLEGLSFAIFDMNRSGAGLAWDFLLGEQKLDWHPKKPETQTILPRPWYVNYVEDRDLWRKQLPGTDEVNAYIMTLPHTLEGWQVLDTLTPDQVFELGKGGLAHIQHYVREALPHAQKGTFGGYPALIVNALYLNISEVAGELAKQCDGIGIGYFERGDSIMQFSLRSRNDVDVSAIAKKFNGGGHLNAAGFQLSVADGRTLVDQILGRSVPWKSSMDYRIASGEIQ